MKLKDITIENISNYISGNINGMLMDYGLMKPHQIEQIMFRKTQCPKSCEEKKQCEYCGCAYPYKLTVTKSCNKKINLPDLMSKDKWEEYKLQNNIE
jgi:hypothetical protein